MMPKNGSRASSVPQGSVVVPRARSIGGWIVSYSVNSSGSVPSRGRMATNPQSMVGSAARMSICSVSPGCAPRTNTGPVMKWGPGPSGSASRAAR